ncbi:MAG TPA: ATP-binding protein [Gammaproteobacteria bacterium]
MKLLDRIIEFTRDISISRKLLLVVGFITNVSLLMISITVIVYDRQSAKSTLKEEINILASVIAKRSTAALAFEDTVLAKENLATLSEKSSILVGCIHDYAGMLFAEYNKSDEYVGCDSIRSKESGVFTDKYYIYKQNILLDETFIGTISIATSLIDINNRLMRHINVVSIIFIAAVIVALLLWYWLQRFITRPIDDLANFSRKIYQDKDYSVRVLQTANDEIGQLYAAFNAMLSGIQERDCALMNAKENLEHQVKERTMKLEQAQNEIIKNERMATLGQLTATVSHEIRNPLGTIRTSVFTLSNKIQNKDATLQRAIERIERNIVRCDNIITELLDFSRIRALQHQVTQLSDWIRNTMDDISVPYDIHIRMVLDDDIDIEIDRDLLHRVLVNVIENASHAITESKFISNDKTIIIQNQVVNDRVEIIVTDTGEGISESVMPRIFEPLFSTKGFGVGLGLPVVKQIMEQHGGGIEIMSEQNVGTRVTLWLPTSLCVNTKQHATSSRVN